MAPPLSMIASLSPQTDSYTLLVRVRRVWESINKRNNQPMFTNLILLDEEDNHILATVRNNQKDVYMPLLTEEGVYTITNVKVVLGPPLYRSVNNDLAINFYYKTKIEKVVDTEAIPHYKFEEFGDIPNYVVDVKNFIDVVGLVINYGQLEMRSNGVDRLEVVLANYKNENVVVTLWEGKADQFLELLAPIKDVPVFTIITGLMTKKYSERLILSSSDATKIYFNIDYAPLNNLRTALSDANGKASEDLPKPSATHFITTADNNSQDSTSKKILELTLPNGTSVLHRTCIATIVALLESEGWYYNCCPHCSRKINVVDGKYYCNHFVKEAPDFKPRYRLIVRVNDDSAHTTFTLFNKEAEQLIGVPVDKLLNEIPEVTSINTIPPRVRNVIGKKCAFEIKINVYNTEHGYEEYSVFRLSECLTPNQQSTDEQTDANNAKKQKTV